MNITKRSIKYIMPLRLQENLTFYKNYKRWINWENPNTFDEKLMVLQQDYTKNQKIKDCIDKFRVRDYVKEKGLGEILFNLIGVYDSSEEIVWEELPDAFVIKCNHGCGYNIIVSNRKETPVNLENIKKWKKQLSSWMKEDYAIPSGEMIYKDIKPKIIIETFIDNKGKWPTDYKFHCSRGGVFAVLMISDREERVKFDLIDCEETELPYLQNMISTKIERPKHFERMLEISKILSEDFPFVKVDLYECDDEIYFGELTFAPHGCITSYFNADGQIAFGGKVQL